MPHATMSQVSSGLRWSLLGGLALLAFLAILCSSGHAAAVGEKVEALDAHVLEGEVFHFNVSLPSVGEPNGARVSVTCDRCGSGWVSQPLTGWRQGTPGFWNRSLAFPSTLFGNTSYLEPRFASNYTISVVDGAGPFNQANVTVHVVNDWEQPNSTYSAGGSVRMQVGGVQGPVAYINISKWAESGAKIRVANLTVPAQFGRAAAEWSIPREHASDMDCPHINGACRNYLVEVTGGGGKLESVMFRAEPARLTTRVAYIATEPPDPDVLPLPGPPAYNRTETVRVSVDVRYANNAPLRPEDRTKAGDSALNGSLKLFVERIVAPAVNNGTVADHEVKVLWAQYTSSRGWRANWTIPRNMSTTVGGADEPLYRVHVPPQPDRWGNLVPSTNGTGFRVTPLHLKPEVLIQPHEEVERLGNASALFRTRYADGTVWNTTTGEENVTASLVGPDGDVYSTAKVEYRGNGTWAAWYAPKLGFRDLDAYRLRINPNRDGDENFLDANDTIAFDIVPAKPRVELHTFVGLQERNDTAGIARGDKALVSAKITYPDGSAFNHTRLPDSWTNLTVNVTKVDEEGLERGSLSFHLDIVDDALGLWEGDFDLRRAQDTDTPLGPWRWTVDLQDRELPTPNGNRSVFTRWVRGAPIEVSLIQHPEPLVRAGEPATLRFVARYANGTLVDDRLAAGGIAVAVAPWKNGAALEPVARLFPLYNASRGDWTAIWATNRTTIVGEYVVEIGGQDVVGNVLRPTTSRTVAVFVEKLLRPVLVEPLSEVHRGEEVIVIFDGADGDIALEGEAAPRIELQKWNPLRDAWEVEKRDVRVANATDTNSTDHVGRLLTSETTNLGEYRFVLQARDQQHALINAISKTFRVLPVELRRSWTGPAANMSLNLSKGQLLELQLERQMGDSLASAAVYRDGQRVVNVSALTRPGRFELTWTTAYTLPDGEYAVVLKGRDIHNNTFASPPKLFNLTGIELRAKQPVPPDAALQRASRLDLRVLIQFPDQQPVRGGNFTARFVLDNTTIAERALEHNHSVWVGNWTPPAGAPLGDYVVVIDGQDGLGNWVHDEPLFEVQLAEGLLQRSFSVQPTLGNRTDTIKWILPADRSDTAMRFTLRDDVGNKRPLNFTLGSSGSYIVLWKPTKAERLGRYVLQAQGADSAGNAILGDSRSMLLQVAHIGVKFLDKPGGIDAKAADAKVKPGEQGTWVFQLQFGDGTVIEPDPAAPPKIIVGKGTQAVSAELHPFIEDGKWVVKWSPEAGKQTGTLLLLVGGQDALGNDIQTSSSQFSVDEGVLKEYLGVPGFEAFLLPIALLGAALLVRGRRQL
ncbi:MAG TPA: hypothetical protein VGR28_07595 [Candidatus Thermoplasmatota archaeon]|nr:hypothetical protein [Candidatus Thermoplasmatota archaeon]